MATCETLRSVIDAGRTAKRLDELSTARIIGKIAQQLHAAEQKAGAGKAVGPVTPSAIALAQSGAATLDLDARGPALAYSAPELVTGGAGDRRSDVFSLGIVLWEALTHQRLFDAPSDEAIRAMVEGGDIKLPMELNANVPAELSAVCMKALARNPVDRYQSTKVMGVEIEEFLGDAGYADSDSQIATHIADMHRRARAQLPPPSIVPKPVATVAPPAPAAALPTMLAGPATAPTPPPPIVAPPAPPPVVAPPPPAPAISPAASEPILLIPHAPVVPASPSPMRSTIPSVSPPPPVTPALGTTPPPTATAADTVPEAPAPKLPAEAPPAPPEPIARTGSSPHPAAAVSLPPPPGGNVGRESQEVLAGWAWQTDSLPAIGEDDDVDVPPGSSRKTLMYVIGAGVALALVVTIIAVGFGGSKPAKDEASPSAIAREGSEPSRTAATTAPAPSLTAPAVGSGSDGVAGSGSGSEVATGSTGSASDVVAGSGSGSAAGSGSGSTAEVAAAGSELGSGSGSGSETQTGPGSGSAQATPPPPPAPPPPPPPAVAKAPPAVAKPPPAPPPAPTRAKATPRHLADPFASPHGEHSEHAERVARAERPKPTPPHAGKPEGSKVDVEAAYRVGLQQFARGDTTGALASLRTSLAGNPNYPPTWRGLGLVFEKMGDKDQAKAAFKRYLQLAPNAGDADQIRGRLERL
ncbi:MAG TPA: tetratricopeptide repeat protein [Kofleriaceae bacterium]|nr:tetratricopeptide repeat protein [Kofleriaceae bacterium]